MNQATISDGAEDSRLEARGVVLVDEAALFRKIALRLIPFLLLAYVLCYIDRSNVSFAYLRFKADVGLTDASYGLGAGIFYLGYVIFEVPSNMLLEKLGARAALLRIMVVWGIVSASTAFVSTPTQFYIVRILLGAAEAGFFPGLILYLSYWFPASRRAGATSMLMVSLCVAGIVGGPLSGGIMQFFGDEYLLKSWQWMFLIEGLPALVMGVAAFFYLDDSPEDARWLNQNEKHYLRELLNHEQAGKQHMHGTRAVFAKLLRDPRIYLLSLAYFFSPWALSVLNFWGPAIIRQSGISSPLVIGLLTVIPNVAGAISMITVGRRSDRMQERRWHFMATVSITAIGSLLLAAFHSSWLPAIVFLTFVSIGQYGAFSVFWSIPPTYLSKSTAAIGIAIISSLGQISGLLSSWMLGVLKDLTGSMVTGLYVVSIIQVTTGLIVVFAFRRQLP
ncbi:MFS transporter [Burkholderia sp. BCC0397]|uniref:MFS transporter n=1 Tax=Burkholderia sp. BCC0397 TaxID=486876 RepID=UPI001FC7D9C6|nr:MFS transporter [Burkholderia sp. BCC0397]